MPPKKDLTGLKFGRLTAIREVGQNKGGNYIWHCICDCGNECDVDGSHLTLGHTQSCGCYNKEIMSKRTGKKNANYKDLTGKKFGRLIALYSNGKDKSGNYIWHCVCECGNEVDVVGSNLIRGNTQSCGCYQKKCISERASKQSGENHYAYKDLTGKKFGRLTVMRVAGQDKWGNYIWHCVCDCGNEVDVDGSHLTRGDTKSCGCLQKERTSERCKKDLTGLQFGRLTVLCEYGRTKKQQVTWLCQCDCGNFRIVRGRNLTTGNTKSCGCYNIEKASERMSETASKQIGENSPSWKGGINTIADA